MDNSTAISTTVLIIGALAAVYQVYTSVVTKILNKRRAVRAQAAQFWSDFSKITDSALNKLHSHDPLVRKSVIQDIVQLKHLRRHYDILHERVKQLDPLSLDHFNSVPLSEFDVVINHLTHAYQTNEMNPEQYMRVNDVVGWMEGASKSSELIRPSLLDNIVASPAPPPPSNIDI